MPTTTLENRKERAIEIRSLIKRYRAAKGFKQSPYPDFEELVFSLLGDNDDTRKEVICYYQSAMVEMLALLSNPKVSDRLPKWLQPKIGKLLSELHSFFQLMDDDDFHSYMGPG